MALAIFIVCLVLMAAMIPAEVWKFLFYLGMFSGLGFIAWVSLIVFLTS